MTPLVSAIVLNYKSPKDCIHCVEALLHQTIKTKLDILLIDNHSNDDSIQFLRNRYRSTPHVRIFESNRNRGYGQGNEIGIQDAQGEYLLIINPDNELEPSGLETMIEKMEKDSSIGILAPQLVHEDGSIRESSRLFPSMFDVFVKRTVFRKFFGERIDRYLQHAEDPHKTRDVDWVAGACLLIRKDLYQELGGFDPRFFLFFEDTDLCRRVWKAGKRVVYFPSVHAKDRKKRLSDGGFLSIFTKKTMRIHLLSGVRYFWKWRGA